MINAILASTALCLTNGQTVFRLLEDARWTRCHDRAALKRSAALYRKVLLRPIAEILAGAEEFLEHSTDGPVSSSPKIDRFFDRADRELIDRRDRESDIRVLSWLAALCDGTRLGTDYGVSSVRESPWQMKRGWMLVMRDESRSYLLVAYDAQRELAMILRRRKKMDQ